MTTKVKRRLTSILCADVKSYSRLMENDETRTIGTLRQYRAAMDALVERHEGRTINTWGDAVIAEFSSVVEAVQCAIEVQRELAARNRELPEAEQMWFRIGINLGDVMVENDDLYGEGVNIAARLQELAEPGGILISGPVYDMVRNKMSVGFEHLGQQAVKNVTEPVISYRIVLDGEARPAMAAARSCDRQRPSAHSRTAWRRDCGRVSAHCRGWCAPRWLSSSSCSSSICPTGRRTLGSTGRLRPWAFWSCYG